MSRSESWAFFDSYSHDLTPEHIVASGSLPPEFPWTTIKGRHYSDGGIISNSSLEQVAARCGLAGKRVYIVELFARSRSLPTNLMEVFSRRAELVYAERISKDNRMSELIADVRGLITEMLTYMEPETAAIIRQRPRYPQLMGGSQPFSVTRIVREGGADEPLSRDFDFSAKAIEANDSGGYLQARKAVQAQLERPVMPFDRTRTLSQASGRRVIRRRSSQCCY